MELLPTQVFCGSRPDPTRFTPVTMYHGRPSMGNGKPNGGMWTSTWETALEDGWPAWSVREGYGSVYPAWLVKPKPCRVYTITDKFTALDFLNRYGVNFGNEEYDLWLPDWIHVSLDLDAVRLTAPYDPELRFATDPKLGSNFYGWDCESTVWLSWQFEDDFEEVDLREYAEANRPIWA